MIAGFDTKPCAVCGVPIGPGRTATCSRPCQDVHAKRCKSPRRKDPRREAYEQQRLELWRRDVHAILDRLLANQGGRS